MADLLDSNQVLLLDNLMYLNSSEGPFDSVISCKDMNVGDYAAAQLEALNRQGNLSDQQLRYKGVLEAVKNDPELSGMVIAGTKTESAANGGGGSAMFVNPRTKEAVVTYRGTGLEEWKDNFTGGGRTDQPDGVSTKYQRAALETYQEYREQLGDGYTMTVTGHSKGGNKAKYITVMDGSVDRCLSYDGQGFSDEFMEKYQTQITQNQDKIANHNVNDDFVNLLLNDIGTTTFYENNRGRDNISLNHYPDAYFTFGENGEYETNVTARSPETAEIDKFLNSALRSMPPDQKEATLALFGDLASYVFHQNAKGKPINMNDIRNILFSNGNLDTTAYFLAYLARYEAENPEFGKALSSYLGRNGLEDMDSIIHSFDSAMDSRWFKFLVDNAGWLGPLGVGLWYKLPGWVRKLIELWIHDKLGLWLSDAQIAALIYTLFKAGTYYKNIDNIPDGSDISYESTTDRLLVDCDYLEDLSRLLQALSSELESLQSQCSALSSDSAVEDIRIELPFKFGFWIKSIINGSEMVNVAGMLNRFARTLAGCSEYARNLSQAVRNASDHFRQTEASVAAGMQF